MSHTDVLCIAEPYTEGNVRMSKVVIVGLGYVGLPLAIRAAEVGHQVVGVDLDVSKIESLRQGVSYVGDVSETRLKAVLDSGHFTAEFGWTADDEHPTPARGFDIAIIAVPTPLREFTTPDLSYVESAGRMLGQILRRGGAVVLESTTYPGTTEGLLADALQFESGLEPGKDFHLGFSPERIDPGNKVFTLETTPKLVSATTPLGLDVIQGFYDTIVETTVPVSSPRVAELAKVFENTQAYVNIALVNELATICHDLDIDVHEMIDAAMTKGHHISKWTPGPGVGGHCLPIDPLYVAWQTKAKFGYPFRMAEVADEINTGRPRYVVQRAQELLNAVSKPVRGTEILVLGVAYKPNVGDVRESPALPIVEALVAQGARVMVVDPHVTNWTLTPTMHLEDMAGELNRFPLSILITDHQEFDFHKIASESQTVLDCRNAMRAGANVVAL